MDDKKLLLMCTGCGKRLSSGDFVWRFRQVTSEGMELYSPACSMECAETQREKNAAMHRARLRSVENQGFQKMAVEDYFK